MVIVDGTIPWAGDPGSCKWREGTEQPFASLFLSGCRKCSQLLPAPTILASLPSWTAPGLRSQSEPSPSSFAFLRARENKLRYHLLCQLRCWQCWQSIQRNTWSWARQDQERGTGDDFISMNCHSKMPQSGLDCRSLRLESPLPFSPLHFLVSHPCSSSKPQILLWGLTHIPLWLNLTK